MNSVRAAEYSTVVTQTQDEAVSLVNRLRLRFDGSQIPLDLNRIDGYLSSAAALTTSSSTIAAASTASLSEMVNYLFEVFGQLDDEKLFNKLSCDVDDTSRLLSDEYQSIKDQFLEFVIKKLEFLISKSRANQSSDFKSLIVLLCQLIRKNFAPEKLVPHYKSFIRFLRVLRDNKVINEILAFWTRPQLDISSIQDDLLPIIKKNLSSKDHRIRSKCLKILAFNFSVGEKIMNTKIIKILNSFADDQEPRVRITALELMILLHLNGISIPVESYENIKNRLFDDFERVRLLSTQLICLLAYSYPEYMVTVGDQIDDEKVRLADDVFSKICIMINDISLDVKVCAGNLIGKIDLVSSRFLLQTLDKKMMNDLRLKKSAQTIRQKQLVANEWSSSSGGGTSSSSDAVITKEDEGNLSLMTSGACGAFIHGLEDEFLEVRVEAVDSLGRQAIGAPKFAAKSIDFLVDMFNDEIESVRLKAIQALTKILHYVLLGDDQIEIVVSVIEDSSFNVRESLRDLLSSCKLATKIGLKKTIQALFNNLRKYPIDKNSIWRCFKCLGKNHAKFVMSLVSYLVSLHPFIDVVEPDINDIYYVSSLILIFNGVNENSAILPLLPRYVINHYFFLKLKLPDLIPDIRLIENYSSSLNSLLETRFGTANQKTRRDEEIERFFIKTKHSLKLINLAEDLSENKIKTYELLREDIKYLCEIDSSISVACDIMKDFVECCLIIKKKEAGLSSFKEKTYTDSQRLIQLEEGLLISIRLILLYKGYSCQEKIVLFKLYLYLRALYLKELYNRKSIYNANSFFNFNINSYLKINIRKDLVKECRLYLSLLKYFDKILDKNFKNLIFQIIKELPIEQNRLKQIEAFINGQRAVETFDFDFLMLSDKPDNYRKMSLELLEPIENPETPIRFTPGLVSAVKVKAIMHNFTRFDNIYIQVTYTDNDKQFIPIEMSSIRPINEHKHLLDATVYLSNLALTDSASIRICITMLIDEYKSIRQNVLENLDHGEVASAFEFGSAGGLGAGVGNNGGGGQSVGDSDENFNQYARNFKNNLNPIELSRFVKLYFEPLAKKFH